MSTWIECDLSRAIIEDGGRVAGNSIVTDPTWLTNVQLLDGPLFGSFYVEVEFTFDEHPNNAVTVRGMSDRSDIASTDWDHTLFDSATYGLVGARVQRAVIGPGVMDADLVLPAFPFALFQLVAEAGLTSLRWRRTANTTPEPGLAIFEPSNEFFTAGGPTSDQAGAVEWGAVSPGARAAYGAGEDQPPGLWWAFEGWSLEGKRADPSVPRYYTFDAALSYPWNVALVRTKGSPNATVTVYKSLVGRGAGGPDDDSWQFLGSSGSAITPESPDEVQRGAVTVLIDPGQLYYVHVQQNRVDASGPAALYLRVSEPGELGAWVGEPNVPYHYDGAVHYGPTWDTTLVDEETGTPYTAGTIVGDGATEGRMKLSKGAYGKRANEADQNGAGIECAWSYARKGDYGSATWTGSCPTGRSRSQFPLASSGVGYSLTAQQTVIGPSTYHDLLVTTGAIASQLSVSQLLRALGRFAGQRRPAHEPVNGREPDLLTAAEDSKITLMHAQPASGAYDGMVSEGVAWFVREVAEVPGSPFPWLDPANGPNQGPELLNTWIRFNDFHPTNDNGEVKALPFEAAYLNEQYGGGWPAGSVPEGRHGLRFVCVSKAVLGEAAPSQLTAATNTTESIQQYHQNMRLDLTFTAVPTNHRWRYAPAVMTATGEVLEPEIPTISPNLTGAIGRLGQHFSNPTTL